MGSTSYKMTKKKLPFRITSGKDDQIKSVGIDITYYCPYIDKEVKIKGISLSSADDECDLCGSHGYISTSINCPCGLNHEIEIDSW